MEIIKKGNAQAFNRLTYLCSLKLNESCKRRWLERTANFAKDLSSNATDGEAGRGRAAPIAS